jgi:hypothetical protein
MTMNDFEWSSAGTIITGADTLRARMERHFTVRSASRVRTGN